MAVTIQIPGPLKSSAGDASALEVAAASVRAALAEIERIHPALYTSICEETGKVRRHVNLFVNSTNIREREGLDTALIDGDVVIILPAVSGG
jgi:molybdopterin synthase sulfur carrier subunit